MRRCGVVKHRREAAGGGECREGFDELHEEEITGA